MILSGKLAESSIRYDSAGNPALDKARARSRIDALQAAVIAACLGEMVAARPVRRRLRYTLVWAKRHYGVVQNTNRLMELSCYFFGFDHPRSVGIADETIRVRPRSRAAPLGPSPTRVTGWEWVWE